MKQCISLILLISVLLSSFALPVFADDVDGSVATVSATEPDASADQVTLADLNDTLGVIQSQLWIIIVVGLLGYVYKFFRLFF